MTLAYYTKQNAVIALFPLLFVWSFIEVRKSLICLVTFAVITASVYWILESISQGWYSFYVYFLPSQHEIVSEVFIKFWTEDLLGNFFAPCFLFLIFFLRKLDKDKVFYLSLILGLIFTSYFTRLHSGAWINNLIPAYLGLSLLAGFYLGDLLGEDKVSDENRKAYLRIPIMVLFIIQFAALFYYSKHMIPTQQDLTRGTMLINSIRSIEGEVLIETHPYYGYLAGKNIYAHRMAVYDILRIKDRNNPVKKGLLKHLQDKFNSSNFEAVLMCNRCGIEYLRGYPRLNYESFAERKTMFRPWNRFWPGGGASLNIEYLVNNSESKGADYRIAYALVRFGSNWTEKEIPEISRVYWLKRIRDHSKQISFPHALQMFLDQRNWTVPNPVNGRWIRSCYSAVYEREPSIGEISYWNRKIETESFNGMEILEQIISPPQDYYLKTIIPEMEQPISESIPIPKSKLELADLFVKHFFREKGILTPTYSDSEVFQFLDRLYDSILNRKPDSDEIQIWTKQILDGQTDYANVLVRVLNSPEARDRFRSRL
jgi:hypothetical protein